MKAVLTFHSIDDSGGILSFPVENFCRLIESIVQSGVVVCSLSELLNCTAEDAVSLTFDDGMKSIHQHALPVLRRYNLPAHIFLTTGFVGHTNSWPTQPLGSDVHEMLSWDEVLDCFKSGFSIDSHTVSHPFLSRLSHDEIMEEMSKANDTIRSRTGIPPVHFAYPYGDYNRNVIEAAETLYSTSCTTRLSYAPLAPNQHMIPRIDTYYLKGVGCRYPLFGSFMRSYISLRGAMRVLRERIT